MTKYRAKSLVSGADVDSAYKGMTLVATPHGADHTQMITFGHEYMILTKKTKPLCIRTFNDKFGRDKQYHLFYHKWEPKVPKAVREVSVQEAIVKSGITLEQLRAMRPSNLRISTYALLEILLVAIPTHQGCYALVQLREGRA